MGKFGKINNKGGFGDTECGENCCKADVTSAEDVVNDGPGTSMGYWEYQLWAACSKSNLTDGECPPEDVDPGDMPCELDSPSKTNPNKKCQAGIVMRPSNPDDRDDKKNGEKNNSYDTVQGWIGSSHPWEDACWLWHGNKDCKNDNYKGMGPFWEVDFCGFVEMGTGDAGGEGQAAAQGSSNVELNGHCEMDCSAASWGSVDVSCPSSLGTVEVFPTMNTLGGTKTKGLKADMFFECCNCGKGPDKLY